MHPNGKSDEAMMMPHAAHANADAEANGVADVDADAEGGGVVEQEDGANGIGEDGEVRIRPSLHLWLPLGNLLYLPQRNPLQPLRALVPSQSFVAWYNPLFPFLSCWPSSFWPFLFGGLVPFRIGQPSHHAMPCHAMP